MDLIRVNGIDLFAASDSSGSRPGDVYFDIAPGWDQYKICGDGTDMSKWQFGDVMAIQATFTAVSGVKMTTYGFRSEAAKCDALGGENTFTVPYEMGKCRLELVVEIPVPGTGPLSFVVRFYVNHGEGGKEGTINEALVSTQVEQDIVVSYESRELASMQIGLVCKQTEQAIPEAAISREPPNIGDGPGVKWIFEVQRYALQNCQSVVWDPLFTPSIMR
jgi:hypothetical protein